MPTPLVGRTSQRSVEVTGAGGAGRNDPGGNGKAANLADQLHPCANAFVAEPLQLPKRANDHLRCNYVGSRSAGVCSNVFQIAADTMLTISAMDEIETGMTH